MPNHNFKDMTGHRIGLLTVIRREPNDARGQARWLCCCDCGTEAVMAGSNLRSQNSSCGCTTNRRGRLTHGQTGARLHYIWKTMLQRCGNPKHSRYRWYGGRGIRVCAEWRAYEAFRDWALANGYTERLTIDRIDNDRGYSPDNCRWATYAEQRLNQRRMK